MSSGCTNVFEHCSLSSWQEPLLLRRHVQDPSSMSGSDCTPGSATAYAAVDRPSKCCDPPLSPLPPPTPQHWDGYSSTVLITTQKLCVHRLDVPASAQHTHTYCRAQGNTIPSTHVTIGQRTEMCRTIVQNCTLQQCSQWWMSNKPSNDMLRTWQ